MIRLQKESAYWCVFLQNLERHIENLTKNHKHEFGIEHARQRDTAQQAEQLRAEVERLQAQLRVSLLLFLFNQKARKIRMFALEAALCVFKSRNAMVMF